MRALADLTGTSSDAEAVFVVLVSVFAVAVAWVAVRTAIGNSSRRSDRGRAGAGTGAGDGPPRFDLDEFLQRQASPEAPASARGGMAADTAARETRRAGEAAERAAEAAGVVASTRAERTSLPLSSLPHEWLQMTASLPRRGALPYLDGMSMLLELAVLGLVDVPLRRGRANRLRSGSDLVVGAGRAGNPTLDGALDRLREYGDPLEARSASIRLAPYLASLTVPSVAAEEGRTRIRDAIAGAGATDIRTGLLLWMLKQDCGLGGVTFDALFPRTSGVSQRTMRRVGPDLYALTDHAVAATAHRVLFALFTLPSVAIPG